MNETLSNMPGDANEQIKKKIQEFVRYNNIKLLLFSINTSLFHQSRKLTEAEGDLGTICGKSSLKHILQVDGVAEKIKNSISTIDEITKIFSVTLLPFLHTLWC